MNLERSQQALTQLMKSGAFYYAPDLATVKYDEYRDILESIDPPDNYSIGYDLFGTNYLENCLIDRDEHGITEMIRRERTYQNGPLRAFNLEIVTVPRLILVTNEPNEPAVLSTTWWVDNSGTVKAYYQTMNDVVLEDIRE